MSLNRIYFVEDDQDDAELMTNAFPGAGYEVIVFPHPLELFHRLHADEILPSLIILDIHMPLIDGLEALRLLKAEPKFARIPVALLTTSAQPSRYVPGKELYFLKPDQFHSYEAIAARLLKHAGPREKQAQPTGAYEQVIPAEMCAHPSFRKLKDKLRADLKRLRENS